MLFVSISTWSTLCVYRDAWSCCLCVISLNFISKLDFVWFRWNLESCVCDAEIFMFHVNRSAFVWTIWYLTFKKVNEKPFDFDWCSIGLIGYRLPHQTHHRIFRCERVNPFQRKKIEIEDLVLVFRKKIKNYSIDLVVCNSSPETVCICNTAATSRIPRRKHILATEENSERKKTRITKEKRVELKTEHRVCIVIVDRERRQSIKTGETKENILSHIASSQQEPYCVRCSVFVCSI